MKYLLDVNVLLAAVWANHPHYPAADAWLKGKSVVVCPISELGFLRISTNKKAIAAPMADARRALETFLRETKATRIADDLPALESRAVELRAGHRQLSCGPGPPARMQAGDVGRRREAGSASSIRRWNGSSRPKLAVVKPRLPESSRDG
jgi:hypothetical protein